MIENKQPPSMVAEESIQVGDEEESEELEVPTGLYRLRGASTTSRSF